MKLRPILMNGAMVRATLEGRKTQTRRIVNPKQFKYIDEHQGFREPCNADVCPHGKPGDQLWVRETHLPKASGTIYRADFSEFEAAGLGGMYGGWKPSIFCKREHSRILLKITDVGTERLQDISEADAQAEGVPNINGEYSEGFAVLWESINGFGSWDANPWIWVINFEVLKA